MSISVSCICGKKLSVKDELAGKRGKCPACGAMLSIPVPPPAKPVEIEEWGLAPLDDDPKPVKTSPAKPAVAKPAEKVAKPQTNAPTKTEPSKPAPTLLADDFGLAPFDDEVAKPAAKPAPAQPVSAKTPPSGSGVSPAASSSANAAPAKKALGGTPPALDLPPLDEQGKLATASTASTANSAKPRAAAAPAKKAADGPAPLDLPPLDGGEEQNHASWIDEGAETEFKVAGAPLAAATGQIFAAPAAPIPTAAPSGGRPGDLLCPHCGNNLDRTLTAGNFITQVVLGLVVGFYFRPSTPFKCRRCGPVAYEELRGESRRTAEKGSISGRGCLYVILAIVGIPVLVFLIVMIGALFSGSSSPAPERFPEQQKRYEDIEKLRLESDKRMEEARQRSEQLRRENEERMRQLRERHKTPSSSAAPRPTPPTPQPMNPAPVNPFQPLD